MTDRHDSYRGVARHYDLHGWDWYAGTYGERLIALLRERNVSPPAAILDVGCGTGSLALLLSREGYRVTGVDLSAEMIARARAKDGASAVVWLVGDMTSLALGTTFDAVISVADVLNHLESLDSWETALRALHGHLRPNGLLCIDAMTCHGLRQLDQQTVQDRGGATLILSVIYEPAARRSTLKITSYAPAGTTGLYERAQETITEWGQPVREVLSRMDAAGFREAERVWATSDEPEDDERMTLIARR